MTVRLPAPSLRHVVSHYWLFRGNESDAYDILPDGAVDTVIERGETDARCLVFGTATRRTRFPLKRGCDYLGVRFRPGRAFNLLTMTPAQLADCWVSASDALSFSLEEVAESALRDDVFDRIDVVLEREFRRCAQTRSRVDDAVDAIEASHGAMHMREAAEVFGRGNRQLQRAFLEAVGLSPKSFARIARFRYASALVASRRYRLADVAAIAGYADQSHMSNDFRNLSGASPRAVLREDVAFLQDGH